MYNLPCHQHHSPEWCIHCIDLPTWTHHDHPKSTIYIRIYSWCCTFCEYGKCVMTYVCVLIHFSHVRLCVMLWTAACQTPLSMRFSRQEYWSGFPCPPPGDLGNPEMEPMSPMAPTSQADSVPLSHWGKPTVQETGV